ncbi:neuraminidase-like domain-containing protein [Serratia marcescens]|uniref:Tc toxin subunit A-related protein n=1 Tax=Serratia marcescens TaxID=615 RepID=UPI0013DB4766|nr:neuraminidase-like domain-containing protein [Serratia marcescens]
MYSTAEILTKLNAPASESGNYAGVPQQPATLADIMMLSLPEVSALSGERITREEQLYLWEQAQQKEKANRMLESRVLSRANPQLAHAVRLGIHQSRSLYAFDDMFGRRAAHFVKPGSVASMFSPAAYLARLYNEACRLYEKGSTHHLDSRRPDLQSLTLSQENLDKEVSTLKVANEVLDAAINKSDTKTLNLYNPDYDSVLQAIQLQDPDFSAFRWRRNSTAELETDSKSLRFMEANISLNLKNLLLQDNKSAHEKLNMLSQATGLPVSDIVKITEKPDANDTLAIDGPMLDKLTHICRYIRRYRMHFSDAQILVNAPPEPFTNSVVAGVLKRVFRLDADELVLMTAIISDLNKPAWPDNPAVVPVFVDYLSQLVQWLEAKSLRPVDLFMMLTVNYSGKNSPFDGKNSPKNRDLLTTLRHGLRGNHTLTGTEGRQSLTDAAAPLVAAVYNLDSAQKGAALLQWLDKQQEVDGKKEGVQTFLQSLLDAPEKQDDDILTDEQVVFVQQLGQLALITQALQLTTAELAFAVKHPEKLSARMTTLSHNLATILSLDSLHHGLQRCGTQGSDILSALQNGTLTAHQLSLVTGVSQDLMAAVLTEGAALSWEDADHALQWTDLAGRLGISCEMAKKLLHLPYDNDSAAEWKAVADALLAALTPTKAMQLEGVLEEARSAMLSTHAVACFTQIWKPKAEDAVSVKDRNDLFNWLLLDNQVSAQVKTTQIGEAIASIQLYVSQALAGQYGKADAAVLSRPFFTEWDRYNKDYSSWAGLAQLVYYPENTIDPTLRIGQTGMMDEMLQTLSQGQLNDDTVESAFKTYLTRFEEIANLNVINAYHDSLVETSGKTYLLSRSSAGQYYWRSADVSLMKDGRLPANAWSEWKKIDIGINATGDLIRPVIFQDRLYLFWLESQRYSPGKTASPDARDKQPDVVEYTLKYAHIKHDGSWSAPVSVVTKSALKGGGFEATEPQLPKALINNAGTVGIFCARHNTRDAVYLSIYDIDKKSEKPFLILKVSPDGATDYLPDNEKKLISVIEYHLDSDTNKKGVNTLFKDSTQTIEVVTPTITNFQGFKLLESPSKYDFQLFENQVSNMISFNFDAHYSNDKEYALNSHISSKFAGMGVVYVDDFAPTLICSSESDGIKSDALRVEFESNKLSFNEFGFISVPGSGATRTVKITLPTLSIRFSKKDFTADRADFRVTYTLTLAGGDNQNNAYQDSFTVSLVNKVDGKPANISLQYDNTSGVKTIQYGKNPPIRINTLFARQLVSLANQGTGAVLSWNAQTALDHQEPDIFNSANALYFWEMFYYIPMMVSHRLLQEARFTEATQWIKYVWRPEGYIVDGKSASRHWNVKPLEDNTDWNASPLDSVDPDAVAQADPMHYKVATFMSYLDLLIARGDAAYRRLERDTLNEAKMWYVQALELLGEEPSAPEDKPWNDPSLGEAGADRQYVAVQQYLLAVSAQAAGEEEATLPGAASPDALFLPQQNEKLQGYWTTLRRRLYNLRHNLSIDGQPLSLPAYASPADPQALLTAAVNASSQSSSLPALTETPVYRFPVILDSAKNITTQLIQFGSSLLSLMQQQDAEKLSLMLQTQGAELMAQSILIQKDVIDETQSDMDALKESMKGAESRRDKYKAMFEEGVSRAETVALGLSGGSTALNGTAGVAFTAAGVMDMAPNTFGLANGGSKWGGAVRGAGYTAELAATALRVTADTMFQNESYRRRTEEWEIQYSAAASEYSQLDKQKEALEKRNAAASKQLDYLTTQQQQIRMQMTFLQNKFTSQALYSWLRGKLASVYYQFYDLAVSRCLMAQKAYQWSTGAKSENFIRPGAWQDNYAGLMAGETLMLNLTQMEQRYLQESGREKEVTRTVCLSGVYAGLGSGAFTLADKVAELLTDATKSGGTESNGLKVDGNQLQATLKLSDLNIKADYPDSLGNTRRIKHISVTLPALVGPYQDVRAVLSYGGSVTMPRGCEALAVSHGMNDSGQFQLDFNDARWLAFEGIPVDDTGTLTLSFPDAMDRQKALLQSLTDIILHIRYTIAR